VAGSEDDSEGDSDSNTPPNTDQSISTSAPDMRAVSPSSSAQNSTSQPFMQIDRGQLAKMDMTALRAAIDTCLACEMHQTRTQTVFGDGHHKADWFIITEAPSADEERDSETFVGPSGLLLTQMLRAIGLAREEVFITNIIKCRTPNNRDPLVEEVHACDHYLQRQIELVQPKIILCLGRIAAQALLDSDLPLGKMRGQVYSYNKHADIPLLVTYHPAYLLRSPKEKRKVWEDLKLARSSFLAGS
jgi:DNA polymerase